MKRNAALLICVAFLIIGLCAPSMAAKKKYKKYGLTEVRGLGSQPFCECLGVKTDQELVENIQKYRDDVHTGFRMAGVPELAEPFIKAVLAGNYTEDVFPRPDEGKILDWMLAKDRKNKDVKVIENVYWTGRKAFEAFRVTVVEDQECATRTHEILVPKRCLNLSHLKSHDAVAKQIAPKASVVVPAQLADGRICIYDTQTIDASGSRDSDGTVDHVEVRVTRNSDEVLSERINSPYKTEYGFQHDGPFTVGAIAVDNCLNRSAEATTNITIDRCIPTADLQLSHAGRAIAGEFLTMDLSGSTDPNATIKSARVTIMRNGKLWAWKDLDGSNLVWTFELRKRGTYEISAYVVDNHDFKSENDVTTILHVRDARHLVDTAGIMINRQVHLPEDLRLGEPDTKVYFAGNVGFSYYIYPEGEFVGLAGIAVPLTSDDHVVLAGGGMAEDPYKSLMTLDFEFNHHEKGLLFGVGVGGWDMTREGRNLDGFLNIGYDLKFTPQRKISIIAQPRVGAHNNTKLFDNFRLTIGLRAEY